MNRTAAVSLLSLCLAAVLYVSANLLVNMLAPSTRIDMTEDRLYTLSEGSQRILAAIEEPVELHFFFSEKLGREIPQYAAYARRVRELLTELEAAAAGKLVLHQHNPEPFSDEEDLATSMGVQGIPVDQSGELVYFGLAGSNSVDDSEVTPFFQPERESLLEYDLVQMIYSLSNPEPGVVGLMSSLPLLGDMRGSMQGDAQQPKAIAKQLQKHFELINLPQSIDRLPEQVKVMMVVHPQAMGERALYELEQFLFRGGRALLFVDPKAESDLSRGPRAISSSTEGLQPLLDKWGIRVPEGKLVGDRSMALSINAGTAARPVLRDYLVWLGVTGQYLSGEDPVTSQLQKLNLASAGFIEQEDDSPLTMEPLIYSSSNSGLVEAAELRGSSPDIVGLLQRFEPDADRYVMAARLSGNVSSAFPDGPPPTLIPEDKPQRQQLMQSQGPINLILVTDSDLLDERFWLQKQQFYGRKVEKPIAGNADFVINALGNLAGSDELLQLRSRGISQRPFERVESLKRQAEKQYQQKERELQNKLRETQTKVARLQGQDAAVGGEIKATALLTPQQRGELEALRQEMLIIRKQLRSVQHRLRQDVEQLEARLQFLNIGLVPLLVTLLAMIVAVLQISRRRRVRGGI